MGCAVVRVPRLDEQLSPRAGPPGGAEGMVAVADHQSAGRGRLGPPLGVAAGRVLADLDPLPARHLTPLNCISARRRWPWPPPRRAAGRPGWARCSSGPTTSWSGEAKLAGVLAEADFTGDGPAVAVVVGIGINVAWPGPTVQGDVPGRLCGEPVDRHALLEALLDGPGARRGLLDSPDGRHELAAELRQRCATLGQRVRVELAAEAIGRGGQRDRRCRPAGRADGDRTADGECRRRRPPASGYRRKEGRAMGLHSPYAPSRDGRCRVHRVKLRPLLGRTTSRGPRRRVRRAHLCRQPTQPGRC